MGLTFNFDADKYIECLVRCVILSHDTLEALVVES